RARQFCHIPMKLPLTRQRNMCGFRARRGDVYRPVQKGNRQGLDSFRIVGHRVFWRGLGGGVFVQWYGNLHPTDRDRKSTRLNSSHVKISYAVFCLKKKKKKETQQK